MTGVAQTSRVETLGHNLKILRVLSVALRAPPYMLMLIEMLINVDEIVLCCGVGVEKKVVGFSGVRGTLLVLMRGSKAEGLLVVGDARYSPGVQDRPERRVDRLKASDKSGETGT